MEVWTFDTDEVAALVTAQEEARLYPLGNITAA